MAIAEWPAAGKWADYALFAGLKLMGIVEAKKYAQDISTDLRQSKIYVENIAPMPGMELAGEWGSLQSSFPVFHQRPSLPRTDQNKVRRLVPGRTGGGWLGHTKKS